MTNIDRAAWIIEAGSRGCRGIMSDTVARAIAEELAEAGLLIPGPIPPDRVHEDGLPEWDVGESSRVGLDWHPCDVAAGRPRRLCFPLIFSPIGVWNQPEDMRQLAMLLLAAVEWAEKMGMKAENAWGEMTGAAMHKPEKEGRE